jgi:hypothetical protein
MASRKERTMNNSTAVELKKARLADIYNGEVRIFAYIKFDPDKTRWMEAIMNMVSPTGNLQYLSKSDYFYWYLKDRDTWVSAETWGDGIPYVKLEILINKYLI